CQTLLCYVSVKDLLLYHVRSCSGSSAFTLLFYLFTFSAFYPLVFIYQFCLYIHPADCAAITTMFCALILIVAFTFLEMANTFDSLCDVVPGRDALEVQG
ncbi:hypothetical protein A2U01_0030773, partial [Trifolium medium]|nr:hypothetical protein [Trifolium medium]